MTIARFGIVAAFALTAGCGHKGPPLAPLHPVPAAPKEVMLGRTGETARLRVVLPAENVNAPGPSVLGRIEIYAVTVGPGGATPPNRDLLTARYRVGSIEVKPPPVEGEAPPANAEADTRPSPGETATFVETLSDDIVKPVTIVVKGQPGAATAGAVAVIGAAVGKARVAPALLALAAQTDFANAVAAILVNRAAAAGAAIPPYAVRVYAVRGLTARGRPGSPAPRVELPLLAPPPPPSAPVVTVAENAVTIGWTAAEATPPTTFNVYLKDAARPLNGAPIAETQYERAGVTFDAEECFAVRSVLRIGTVDLESDPVPVCVTPRDTFPPAPPAGLSVVAAEGAMQLSWDGNSERDLAGYLVLRGAAPGETLQPLASAPTTGTSFEDKTAKPGVRYVYAVVAVDKAVPPNRSAASSRVEETAR